MNVYESLTMLDASSKIRWDTFVLPSSAEKVRTPVSSAAPFSELGIKVGSEGNQLGLYQYLSFRAYLERTFSIACQWPCIWLQQ